MPKKKTNKKSPSFFKRLQTLSIRTKLLFLIGIFFVIIPVFFYTNETIQLAFFTPKVPIIARKLPPPTYIYIPKVNIALPVAEEAITNGGWGIASDSISHLNTSARPGEIGPIILYGHNTNDRFGPIRWLSKGDMIRITTLDGKVHIYTIVHTEDVSPNQISELLRVHGETLVLYTCDGFADLQRFLVFAIPVK